MRSDIVALLFGLLAAASVAATDPAGITIVRADRSVDLKTQLVHIDDRLILRNTDSAAVSSFLYCLSSKHVAKLAYIAVIIEHQKIPSFHTRLPVPVDGIPAARDSGVVCFSLPLQKALAGGATVSLAVHVVLTRAQTPKPAHITQEEPQRVQWEGTLYLQSPYPVAKQQLKIETEGDIFSFTDAPPMKKTKRAITYGPYQDISAPFYAYGIKLHYVNNAPFAAATQLDRELEVSHWGNIYVEERYAVTHHGAKLKGTWSRTDYTKSEESRQASFRHLMARTPLSAHTFYFRDAIGNVSSSQLMHTPVSVDAMLAPRFPLFGGWSTDFVFGYSLPLSKFVMVSGDSVRTLRATLGPAVRELVVDNLTLRVVLPEGAYDITPALAVEADISYETKYTYLDTAGRPVLVIKLSNVVDHFASEFLVHYRMRPFAALREPALLVGTVALIFAAIIAWLRLDFSITRDATWLAAQRKERATGALQRIVLLIAERRKALGRTGAEGSPEKAAADEKLKISSEKLRELAKESETAGRSAFLKDLLEKERAAQAAAAQLAARKQKLLAEGKDASAIAAATEAQERTVAALLKEVTALADGLLGRV